MKKFLLLIPILFITLQSFLIEFKVINSIPSSTYINIWVLISATIIAPITEEFIFRFWVFGINKYLKIVSLFSMILFLFGWILPLLTLRYEVFFNPKYFEIRIVVVVLSFILAKLLWSRIKDIQAPKSLIIFFPIISIISFALSHMKNFSDIFSFGFIYFVLMGSYLNYVFKKLSFFHSMIIHSLFNLSIIKFSQSNNPNFMLNNFFIIYPILFISQVLIFFLLQPKNKLTNKSPLTIL
jgi:hypothetical protein